MARLLIASARRIHAEFGFRKLRFFIVRYVQLFPHSHRWLGFIERFHRRHTGAPAPVEMLRTKFMRTYYSRRVRPGQRLLRLRMHYELLEARLSNAALAGWLEGKVFPLGEVTGRDGHVYGFTLGQHDRYRAEGEITLFMRRDGEDPALAALTFGLGRDRRGGLIVRIGGLQGPQAEDARQRVVDATKALNGLRPKAAALHMLYTIAEAFGARRIEAVGMDNHPLRNAKHAFVADSDAFWDEAGGRRTPQGDFVLPRRPVSRNVEEVPAKRRKDWLKRQEIKAELAGQGAAALMHQFKR